MLVTTMRCWLPIHYIEKVTNMLIRRHQHLTTVTIMKSPTSQFLYLLSFRQYIYDADERQCRKLQDIAHSLRSSYNTVYHTLTNNYDKITAPRGQGNQHIHLY